jgi:23S rRNA pseudouridine955/2504/2580 synthase
LTPAAAARRFDPMTAMDEGRELIAGPDDAGRRLDKVLRALLADRSLSSIYAALRKGRIRVNGTKADPELRVSEGDRIYIHSSLGGSGTKGRALAAADVDAVGDVDAVDNELGPIADILVLATRDLIFINKPRGELSQGSAAIEGRIREALARRSASSLSFVPGPLHRLDRNTTGLLAFPRSAEGARAFSSLIRKRKLIKRYIALVDGEAPAPSEWRDRMARDGETRRSSIVGEGDEALAFMKPLLSGGGRSLLLIELHTGLTHQIRVQASSRGMPLSGDAKYGGSRFPGGYILHALSLEFPEPPFPDLPSLVTAPPPVSALDRLGSLFGRSVLRDILDTLMKIT